MREPTWSEVREWAERMLAKVQEALETATGEQTIGQYQGQAKILRLALDLPDILKTRETIQQQIAAKQAQENQQNVRHSSYPRG